MIKKAQTELKDQKNYDQLSNSLRLVEEEGILRCKGRLKNSDLELSARYPIILPKDHRLTELLVRKSHSDVHHCGVRATLCRLRSKYWVVKGRQLVKRIVGKCITCKENHTVKHQCQIYQGLESDRQHHFLKWD